MFVLSASIACAPAADKLKVSVRHSFLVIEVQNEEDQGLKDVSVMVNEKYFCPKAEMQTAERKDFNLISCASLDGERFNPIATVAVNVYVSATLARDLKKVGNGFVVSSR